MSADRPYVDRRVVDHLAAERAAVEATHRWDLAPPQLVRTGMNAIYGSGDCVLRVGRASAPAVRSHELAIVLLERGVPVVAPRRGLAIDLDGFAVTAWDRIEPADAPIDWEAVGAAVARVHEMGADDVPDGYPLPSPTAFPWWDFDALFSEVGDEIDDAAAAGLLSSIERHRPWRDEVQRDNVVCHGDVHPGNVLSTDRGPLLIDWDLLCTAPPGWDHAMLVTYAARWGGEPGVYAAFAAGYGRSLADDAATGRFAELRNVAATLMRVRAGRTDEVARTEAERRLRYWRGEPDAPVWRAQ